MAACQISVTAATVPFPGEMVNGDGWRVDWHGNSCRITVIDGLGHGVPAADATSAALAALAAEPMLGPADALDLCHRALHHTRGAAVGVATIDLDGQVLSFAGVGNVEARVWQTGIEKRLSSARGIVGAGMPSIHTKEVTLEPGWRLVLHTDGVSARFSLLTDLPTPDVTLQELADTILASWGQSTDDATAVVAGDDRQ